MSRNHRIKKSIFRIIDIKWNGLCLSFMAILYGFTIFMRPEILETYKVYAMIREITDNHKIGIIFIILGIGKLIGIIKNNKKIKKFSVQGLLFLWLLFTISFFITPPPNTVWILGVTNIFLAIGAVKEDKFFE